VTKIDAIKRRTIHVCCVNLHAADRRLRQICRSISALNNHEGLQHGHHSPPSKKGGSKKSDQQKATA